MEQTFYVLQSNLQLGTPAGCTRYAHGPIHPCLPGDRMTQCLDFVAPDPNLELHTLGGYGLLMISSRTSLGRTPRDRWYLFCEFVLTYFITSEYNYFSNRHTNTFILQRKILSHTDSLTRLVSNKRVTREVLQNENAYKLSLYIRRCETSHELSQLWKRNLQGTRNELS